MSEIDAIFASKPKSKPKPKPKPQPTRKVSSRPAPAQKQPRKTSAARAKQVQQFRDSRGTHPRRKTEEGWNVYKEDELGITAHGGDTPLCPFDCQCCF
ncbi:hypothetical protein Ac2012v2_000549 [Leucoagaricus gongylophorus]